MNIQEIKSIVNNQLVGDEIKEKLIINSLSKDKKIIPIILNILNKERENNAELIEDMNLELSRSHVFIDTLNPNLIGKKETQSSLGDNVTKEFITDKIAAFYIKYKDIIVHCFNRFN